MGNHLVWGLVPAAPDPLLRTVIRANGDKVRAEGLRPSWGWKGGGNPFSKRDIPWPDQEGKGETVGLWGPARA